MINNIKVDNFSEVAEADWVVETVVERIDIKHNIYEKIFGARKKSAIVSSKTSSDDDLFKLELGAFMRLIETSETKLELSTS